MVNCSGDDRQKNHPLLTNQLSGNMLFLIQRSSRAWTIRGELLCRWTPPLPPPFHVFLGAASNVKATSLCFCIPKSAHNTKEKFFFLFLPMCSCAPVSIKPLHNCRCNNSAQNVVRMGKSTVKYQLTWLLISFVP